MQITRKNAFDFKVKNSFHRIKVSNNAFHSGLKTEPLATQTSNRGTPSFQMNHTGERSCR